MSAAIRVWYANSKPHLGRHLGLLGCALVLLVSGLQPALGVADSASATVFIRYHIDRSLIPSWVTHQELTLRIRVGTAEAVWAWGDGQPLVVRHDARRGIATVTTSASELLLAARGEGLNPTHIGDYSLAALKEDKLWAYSLTFDDGKLSVYRYALPELRRYGYRAAVAVIGWWLDRQDALEHGYCSIDELRELLGAGWSLFNHGYSHDSTDIRLSNALRCQEALRTKLGYEATVFTVPHTDPLRTDPAWIAVIDGNMSVLGLRVMQLSSGWNGSPFSTRVDQPITLSGVTYKIGRLDYANDPQRTPKRYFDEAHGRATSSDPQYTWISLHGHDPDPLSSDPERVKEWCGLAESMAYLYHTYGAGGTDEVWVAPADEVFQYMVVRSYARVTRGEGLPHALGPTLEPDQLASYQQGLAGYQGWRDTFLREWTPTATADREGNLAIRGAAGLRESALLRADLSSLAGATVLSATLSLYATNLSNEASVTLNVYPLLRSWVPAEATWLSAARGIPWAAPGARAFGVDRGSQAQDVVRVVGRCSQAQRWYAFDVTELVQTWLAHPEENYGLLLEGSDGVSVQVRFASSEYYDPSKRPVLRVLYRWPSPDSTPSPSPTLTPEPTSMPTPSLGWIRGEVWEDTNRNGLREVHELALGDVLIELRDGARLLSTQKTRDDGGFVFLDLAPGVYVVTAIEPPGYIPTTSSTQRVAVYAGRESWVQFGNYRLFQVRLPLVWR